MKITKMKPTKPGNAFHNDLVHMGQVLGKVKGAKGDIVMMYPTHPTAVAEYIILVNEATGQRVRISGFDDLATLEIHANPNLAAREEGDAEEDWL